MRGIMVAKVDSDSCAGCEACVDECPVSAISLNDEIATVDESLCTECGVCVDICPTGAISL